MIEWYNRNVNKTNYFKNNSFSNHKMMISNAVQQLGNDKIGIGQIGITYAKTIAVTGVRFKMASGNIDSGEIRMYGLKDS